jgi:hypothetical protein
MTTLNLLRPTFRGLAQPDDLYEMARAFIAGNTAAGFSFFAPPFALANWQQLHQQVPPPFHKTLHRCINWALRSFSPDTERRLHATPEIAMDLRRAKTDRTDLRTTPYSLSRLLIYYYYASIVDTFGDEHARGALAAGNLILLGLRTSSSTLANDGIGSYDDTITVLKGMLPKAANSSTFPACTEPGAQYSQRAGPKPGGKKGERQDDRYKDIKFRKVDGEDVNADGIRDAGRLIEATYRYAEKPGGHVGARAFQVGERVARGKRTVFVAGPNQVVERDVDGDGNFNDQDGAQRIDPTLAGTTMYIHRGGMKGRPSNTASAGCQTIPPDRYSEFLGFIPSDSMFYYVLVNAS